jgi:hypothetical protein
MQERKPQKIINSLLRKLVIGLEVLKKLHSQAVFFQTVYRRKEVANPEKKQKRKEGFWRENSVKINHSLIL